MVVIGIGNAMRGDDAAGVQVARRMQASTGQSGRCGARIEVRALEGETLALLDAWEGAEAVVLIDAVRSGRAAGTIQRVDASSGPLPESLRGSSSTHAVGVGDAIELARALGRLPRRVVLFGVEGHCFDTGARLSPAVATAAAQLPATVLSEARRLASLGEPRGGPCAPAVLDGCGE